MKALIKTIRVSITLSLMVFITSCTDDEIVSNPTEGLTKISDGYALGAAAKVELWAKESLFAGYNPVFFALYDSVSGKRITDAHIHLHPEMSMMGGMNHSCFVENPDEEAINNLFPASIAFVMPSGDMGLWSLEVSVHNHLNNQHGEAEFDITVVNPPASRIKSFVTGGGEKIFIAYHFPNEMKVGINDLEIIAFRKDGDFEFNPIESLTMTLEPEMPSMGHGSPNNVNPVHTSNGHYAGKVNFTMTGGWRLNLDILEGSTLLQELFFDVGLE
jgi:hypothetical protein